MLWLRTSWAFRRGVYLSSSLMHMFLRRLETMLAARVLAVADGEELFDAICL